MNNDIWVVPQWRNGARIIAVYFCREDAPPEAIPLAEYKRMEAQQCKSQPQTV